MLGLLKTDRLDIKAISQEDRPALCELLLDDEIKKTYMIPEFADEKALDHMADRFVILSASKEHYVRGIYLNNRLIGFVNDVEIKGGCIELGYVIHPSKWGKGYATEMLRAVIGTLLDGGYLAIRTGAFSENAASIRVMEKCGMHRSAQVETIEYRGKAHTCVYYEVSKER